MTGEEFIALTNPFEDESKRLAALAGEDPEDTVPKTDMPIAITTKRKSAGFYTWRKYAWLVYVKSELCSQQTSQP